MQKPKKIVKLSQKWMTYWLTDQFKNLIHLYFVLSGKNKRAERDNKIEEIAQFFTQRLKDY